jgi:hypothetical protein
MLLSFLVDLSESFEPRCELSSTLRTSLISPRRSEASLNFFRIKILNWLSPIWLDLSGFGLFGGSIETLIGAQW